MGNTSFLTPRLPHAPSPPLRITHAYIPHQTGSRDVFGEGRGGADVLQELAGQLAAAKANPGGSSGGGGGGGSDGSSSKAWDEVYDKIATKEMEVSRAPPA